MSNREFYPISQQEMEDALGLAGGSGIDGLEFRQIRPPGTSEIVYEADMQARGFAVRCYSSIVSGTARGVGQDAIRIVKVFYDVNGKAWPFKAFTVNRIVTWRKNLQRRIIEVRDMPVRVCPKCGRPMKERTGPYGKFFGCASYPKCDGKSPA